jgi:hypothetical protein
MTIRDKFTSAGGNRAYKSVRSKISKDKFGYGKRVSLARENLMQKLGRDPGVNTVASHVTGGSHFEKGGGKAYWNTRSDNTSDSNKAREKIRDKKFEKKEKK